jgi:polysaccharide biosynthesis/export protein
VRAALAQRVYKPCATSRGGSEVIMSIRSALLLGCFAGLLSATGCVETHVSVSRGTPLRQFLMLSERAPQQDYRLLPGDQLTARFYYNPQLDEDVQVRPDGNISLSLIGELSAAGKTTRELSAEITQGFAKYFTKPTAIVIVREFNGYRVFTSGQLRNPGQLNLLTGARTVLESLAASGGVTDEGTLTHVMLVRKLPTQAEPMICELDLADALSGEDLSQDVALMPNDLIYVPRSGAADLNLAMQQYIFNNLNLTTGVGVSGSVNLTPTQSQRNTALNGFNGVPGSVSRPTPTVPSSVPTTPPPVSGIR